MAKFLTATDTEARLESMLKEARGHLVIISPYIKPNDNLLSRLTDAAENNHVRIQMVCRKDDLKEDQRAKLEQIDNLELRFNELLHAKCFYDDKYMVITSRNLYDKASGNNHEMGVLLNKTYEADAEAFNDAKKEAEFIIRQSSPSKVTNTNPKDHPRTPTSKVTPTSPSKKEQSLEEQIFKVVFGSSTTKKVTETNLKDSVEMPPDKVTAITQAQKQKHQGYCIKCGEPKPLNRRYPYCPTCYEQWRQTKDPSHIEQFCHRCRQPAKTSINQPLCVDCINQNEDN